MVNIYLNSFIFEILFFLLLLFLLLQKTGITITSNLYNSNKLFSNTCKNFLYFFEFLFILFLLKSYFNYVGFSLLNIFFNFNKIYNLKFITNIFIYIQLKNIFISLTTIINIWNTILYGLFVNLNFFKLNIYFIIQLKYLGLIIKMLTVFFIYNIYLICENIINLINLKNFLWINYYNSIPLFKNFKNYTFTPEITNYKLFDYNYFIFYNKYILLFFIVLYILLINYYQQILNANKKLIIFTYEYPILIGFLFLGYIFVISTNNIFIVYLGLEIQTFSILLLTGQLRNLYLVVITNLKYFFYSFLSSLFFLLGILYIYNFTGTLNYYELYYYFLYNLSYNINNYFVILGLNLLLLSFMFKLGLFPFYIWVLDIFEGFPRLIVILLLTLNKFNLYVFLLKFITIISSFNILLFNFNIHFLTLSSLFSIGVGSFLALTQTNLQRFFGATSITHLGFLLLLIKINILNYNFNSLYLIYSYFILYMFLTYLFFGSLIIWKSFFNNNILKGNLFLFNYIKDLSWFNTCSKKTMFALILILINLSGFPPFSFFYIKFNLMWLLGSVLSNFDLILLLFFSTLITGSYIRLISILWLENVSSNINNLYLYKYYLQHFFINNKIKKDIIKFEYIFLSLSILIANYNYFIFNI